MYMILNAANRIQHSTFSTHDSANVCVETFANCVSDEWLAPFGREDHMEEDLSKGACHLIPLVS